MGGVGVDPRSSRWMVPLAVHMARAYLQWHERRAQLVLELVVEEEEVVAVLQ